MHGEKENYKEVHTNAMIKEREQKKGDSGDGGEAEPEFSEIFLQIVFIQSEFIELLYEALEKEGVVMSESFTEQGKTLSIMYD